MKRTVWIAVIILVISAVLLSACGGGGGGGTERQAPPAEFANATNPFEGNADAVTQGQQLYTSNCVGCHGAEGAGDGAAGASLDPKPANLQNTAKETDPAYQHCVITKGGAAAGLSPSPMRTSGGSSRTSRVRTASKPAWMK
jgi:cytochrome c553